MKISVELKDLLVNNALTTIVHFVLMVVLLPLNILFPILLPIFIGIYIWCGYKWMLPTRHANYLSVLLITLVLLTLVVTLLATGTFASYQIATWLSVWSLAVSLLAGLAFPSLFWSEGQEVLHNARKNCLYARSCCASSLLFAGNEIARKAGW